jgi:hypothetical protein
MIFSLFFSVCLSVSLSLSLSLVSIFSDGKEILLYRIVQTKSKSYIQGNSSEKDKQNLRQHTTKESSGCTKIVISLALIKMYVRCAPSSPHWKVFPWISTTDSGVELLLLFWNAGTAVLQLERAQLLETTYPWVRYSLPPSSKLGTTLVVE